MTYDTADHYLLLFGGAVSGGYGTNATWIYDNETWKNITSTAGTAPQPSWPMLLTYDAVDHYVLGFDLSSGPWWSFAHGKWTKLQVSGNVSSAPYNIMMSYDSEDSYVVATNGSATWKYTHGIWSPVYPAGGTSSNSTGVQNGPGLPLGFIVDDPAAGYVLFYGFKQNPLNQNLTTEGYTWKYLGGSWTNISSTAGTPPQARYGLMETYDSALGGVVLFGGQISNRTGGGEVLNETWLFSNGTWTNVTTSPSPSARYGGEFAYDPALSTSILYGGNDSKGQLYDTWAWGINPPIGGLSISASTLQPLPNSSISFNASFNGGTAPFSYSWNFGDGNTSSSPNPTHSYSSEGYYRVSLWLNDSGGHSTNTSIDLRVYTPLSISKLTATPNPVAIDQPINFTMTTSGGIPPFTYSWSFGDGGTGGNLSSITHYYTTNGPFTVEASVKDSAGATVHSYLNITTTLQALASSKAVDNSPSAVYFVGGAEGGNGPYTFLWNFGDGTPNSPLQNVIHTYGGAGKYIVTLTVTDSKNVQSIVKLVVQVGGATRALNILDSAPLLVAAILLTATVISAAWGASYLHRRSAARAGNKWLNELSLGHEPPKRPKN